jgi:hypothetical protein
MAVPNYTYLKLKM